MMKRRWNILQRRACVLSAWLVACAWLCSCSCRQVACGGVDDARRTIAVADSLRVNAGMAYDDSIALVRAVEAFDTWSRRTFHPADYAKANYYYGRLLRNHGDLPAAMLAFLRAAHTDPGYPARAARTGLPFRTVSADEYAMLGRVYSNIGTMCHQAKAFELSYDVYEISGKMFMNADDTISYYYTLNSMAYECAELKDEEKTLLLIDIIEKRCCYTKVLTKTWETRTELYKNMSKYDSAITAARELYARGYYAASGYVAEAQSFWRLQQYDSALFYAQLVMEHPYATSRDKFNMLYILTYNDSTINLEEVKKRAEARADIDKEILDPLHEQLAQAVTLLREDLNQQADRKWMVVAIVFLLIGIATYIGTQKRRVARKQELQLQEMACEERMRQVEKEENNVFEQLQHLNQKQQDHRESRMQEIEQQCTLLCASNNIKRSLHLSNYSAMKQLINCKFNRLVDKLETEYTLSEREIQFCILVLLNIPQRQIAELLVYSEHSIKNTKANTAKKMKVMSSDLRNHLIDIILQQNS